MAKKKKTVPVKRTPEEDAKFRALAQEFLDNGKGRPPTVLVPYINQLQIKRKQAITEIKKKGREETQSAKRAVLLEAFVQEFIKNGGNATQAALAVNPNLTTVLSASQAGSSYLKESKGIARVALEKRGYNYGKFLDVAVAKMEEGKNPDWWDRLMKMAGYEDFITKTSKQGPQVVNIVGAHRKDVEDFGFAEDDEVMEGEFDET